MRRIDWVIWFFTILFALTVSSWVHEFTHSQFTQQELIQEIEELKAEAARKQNDQHSTVSNERGASGASPPISE